MKTFICVKSKGLFGDFSGNKSFFDADLDYGDEVMARSPEEAALRFMKRKHALKELRSWNGRPHETDKTFGRIRVVPKSNPFPRFVTYWN